jgi:hypothetical protein
MSNLANKIWNTKLNINFRYPTNNYFSENMSYEISSILLPASMDSATLNLITVSHLTFHLSLTHLGDEAF